MDRAMKDLLTAAFAVITMSGAAMAGTSHICAYVNDNVAGPNAAEGYMVGHGAVVGPHVGPYSTNGQGNSIGFFVGSLGATRVHPRLKTGDLYVEDAASDNITHFTINKADCTLTLDTTLYPSGDTNFFNYGDVLAITPDGRTMFVGSTGDFHIYSHTIAASGSLGATFTEASTSDTPQGIEVSPDGKILVVAYPNIFQVCAYPIAGGHLGTPNCQTPAGLPFGVSIDSASACVYAGEANSNSTSEVAAFTLTEGVLGAPTDYKPFGPGQYSVGVLVNWNNKAIYVSEQVSAQLAIGSIASGCKLTYKTIISDGVSGSDYPSQIAQGKRAHGYLVTGSFNTSGTPSMGIFQARANGMLTPIGSGQFPLMSGAVLPTTVVVVGSE
jgi:6-phosphogluconolactonase (cycloisomerase 2 family)